MLFNYHTHTARCNHAVGTEREYIEAAIANGVKTLGFSDHAPYIFPDGRQSDFRMTSDQLFSYAETVRALAKEYQKDMRILCGFELEYYPQFHADEMQFLRQVSPDFLLLGQHFLHNETDASNTFALSGDDSYLTQYVNLLLEAIATGDFLYIAHPDLIGTDYSPTHTQRELTRLCEGAKALHIPLEINLLGLRQNRRYPSPAFFEIAAKVGNDVILGVDAHSPDAFFQSAEERAREMAKSLGLRLIEKPLTISSTL